MAHTADPAAVVVDQETLIQGVAKHFLQKVFGPEGMPWGTKFSDLEELTVQIGQAVSRSMMDQALAGQAQAVPAERSRPVGSAGPPSNPVPRPNHGPSPPRWGRFTGSSRKRYCPTMSGGFFSLSPRVWGLTTASYSPHVRARSSTPGSRTRRSPPAGTICSTWLA